MKTIVKTIIRQEFAHLIKKNKDLVSKQQEMYAKKCSLNIANPEFSEKSYERMLEWDKFASGHSLTPILRGGTYEIKSYKSF